MPSENMRTSDMSVPVCSVGRSESLLSPCWRLEVAGDDRPGPAPPCPPTTPSSCQAPPPPPTYLVLYLLLACVWPPAITALGQTTEAAAGSLRPGHWSDAASSESHGPLAGGWAGVSRDSLHQQRGGSQCSSTSAMAACMDAATIIIIQHYWLYRAVPLYGG